jgi:hypothetical protein
MPCKGKGEDAHTTQSAHIPGSKGRRARKHGQHPCAARSLHRPPNCHHSDAREIPDPQSRSPGCAVAGAWVCGRRGRKKLPARACAPFKRLAPPLACVLNTAQTTPQRVYRPAAGRVCALKTGAQIPTCISRHLRRWRWDRMPCID